MRIVYLLASLLLTLGIVSCRSTADRKSITAEPSVMELRVVKGQPQLFLKDRTSKSPYPRERLGIGARFTQDPDTLSWLRADSGAILLLSGRSNVTVTHAGLSLAYGRLFIDTQGGPAVEVTTARGVVEAAEGRCSITVAENGALDVYVLRGKARFGTKTASAGETLRVSTDQRTFVERTTTWDDWTLGLGTADPEAQAPPFGVGTIGGRAPSEPGKPRFPLVIQRLLVRVTINDDFATTEVDETFLNPSEATVEGLYRFAVPPNAVLSRFSVDRDGMLVFGRIREKTQAKTQYESHVYAGSTEDPALLEWIQKGVYQARLFPIPGGTTRRLVTRYNEWLGRHGARGERRLYVYPLAASGAEGSLPRIEEMTVVVDYSKANATRIVAPRGATVRNQTLVVNSHDFTPKSDVFVELFDSGRDELVAYRARHDLAELDVPEDAESGYAKRIASEEQDYVLLSLPTTQSAIASTGLDLAIVVDSSAGTDPRALALGRHLVAALLNALGPKDRVALFTGDTSLYPVVQESATLAPVDDLRRKAYLAALADVPSGGATDLGALLSLAAERLDTKRKGAVIYIGDGRPSVGEMLSKSLRERLERLPPTTRLLAAGTGPDVNVPLLESLVRGGPLELIGSSYDAALAALRLLEATNSDSWQGSFVELKGLERTLPKQVPSVAAGQPALVVGRVSGKIGDRVSLKLSGKVESFAVRVVPLADEGDLRRRWGEGRLAELLEQHAGRLSMIDVARRYGLVTPFTSLYVATRAEAEAEGQKQSRFFEDESADRDALRERWRPWTRFTFFRAPLGHVDEKAEVSATAPGASADNREGGTGTRAKGEEGSMGHQRAGNRGPLDAPIETASEAWGRDANVADGARRKAVLEEAQNFGMIGNLSAESAPTKPAVAATGLRRSLAASQPGDPLSGLEDAKAANESVASPAAAVAPPAAAGAARGRSLARSSDAVAENSEFVSGRGRLSGSHRADGGRTKPAPTPPTPPKPSLPSSQQPPKPTPLVVDTHRVRDCSKAADLPLAERRKLWLERLSGVNGTEGVLSVYRTAIAQCEAPNFLDRQQLLYAMVGRMGIVADRVKLYRSLLDHPAAAMVVYRAILARIVDAEGMKQLHVALGIQRADEAMIGQLVAKSLTSKARVATLRDLVKRWPEDLELGLKLLFALEDDEQTPIARGYAQKLRRRSDATTHVRMQVGEFYLRQAAKNESSKTHDTEEALRCFGEIVEFATEDPVARRNLGDLLLAHGWFDEAFRQYQTLQQLTPEDPSVELRLAEAAFGMGKTEEALRWTEKARATASPDGQTDLERATSAWASVFVAWSYERAIAAKQTELSARLLLRGQRLRSSDWATGTKYILTWSHPELKPSLWFVSSSGERPARNMVLLGVAEGTGPDVSEIEIRFDAQDYERVERLSASLLLTAIIDEGKPTQRTITKQLTTTRNRGKLPLFRLRLSGFELVEEVL